MKETIDLGLLNNFLVILKKIEEGDYDQHEASVEVGQILKQIYIDSAVKEGEISDKKYNKSNTKKTRKGKSISWADYKKLNPSQNAIGN
jgi:ABC-type multidrug transport system permease subunit